MEIESLCPFPVATVIWEPQPGERRLTVCVKATYALAHGGTAEIAAAQVPVCGELHESSSPDASLYAPSDFAPLKLRADILLVGHAYAPGGAPVESLVARMRAGGVSKALHVTGDGAWVSARAAGFGPIPAAWRARAHHLSEAAARWAFQTIQGPTPAGFDFGFFNAAPPDQQVESLPASLDIALENLSPRHAKLETRLPSIQPKAFRVSKKTGLSYEVLLRCDTLWIDTDRAIAVVSWRGSAAVPSGDEQALGRLVITTDKHPEPLVASPTTRDALAGGSESVTETKPTGDEHPADATLGIAESLLRFRGARPLPSGWASKIPDRSKEDARPSVQSAGSLEGLPFRPLDAPAQGEPLAEQTPPEFEDVTLRILPTRSSAAKDVLPFKAVAPGAAPLVAVADRAAPAAPPGELAKGRPDHRDADASATIPIGARSQLRAPPLPFKPHSTGALDPAPATAPVNIDHNSMVIQPLSAPAPASQAPVPYGETSIAVEIDADSVSIERCATIAAELDDRRTPRADVLRAHGLTEEAWASIDRRWMAAIAKGTERGASDLLSLFDATYVTTVERLRGPITPDEYARLTVGVERASARPVLAELHIQRPALMRIQRAWQKRIAQDPELAVKVREALQARRAERADRRR